MILALAAVFIATLVLWLLFQTDPPPLRGVYSQPGRGFILKKLLFKCLLNLRKFRRRRKEDVSFRSSVTWTKGEHQEAGYGIKSFEKEDDMDGPQPLIPDEMAIDTHYFNAFDADGTAFILRIARRHHRRIELWISVDVPELGFFQAPIHPDTSVHDTDPESISGGGLKFECLEPMRRWKITYNGLLRKGMCNDWHEKDKLPMVHVKFSFIWEAVSSAYDFDTDSDPSAIADAVAREKWTKEFWARLRSSHQTHYEQQGEMRGVFKVEGQPEKNMVLKSIRDHTYGKRDWFDFYRYVVHFIYLEDGSSLHVNSICIPKSLSMLRCGYMSRPNGIMLSVSGNDLDLPNMGLDMKPPQEYSFSFTTSDGKTRHLNVTTRFAPEYYHHDDWRSMVFEKVVDVVCDGVKGYGIAEWLYRCDKPCPVPPKQSTTLLKEPASVQEPYLSALTLPFTELACCSSQLVGGKGCQLAFLTQMQGPKDFTVPKGLCLTVNAYRPYITQNPHLSVKLRELSEGITESSSKSVEECCKAFVEEILKTPVSEETMDTVWKALQDIFPEVADINTLAFAVRSSALGEDSSDLSAAGQMDTLLGVKRRDQMEIAIRKCWASHFNFIAVQYRKQHGQPLNPGMGIVIQQMAPVSKAGVLFTLDPVTSNPGVMVINANYGLGESVVSGSSEPDLIRVKRTWDNQLSILSEEVGSKKTQITLMDSGGIKEEEVSEKAAGTSCLSHQVALRLAAIGVELEKRFSDPRDIEWGVDVDGMIYLLQARPITTVDQETDWQLMHEFDSPLAYDKEILTTANIGEMMPGAVTPLTNSTFLHSIDHSMQLFFASGGVKPHPLRCMKNTGTSCNHAFINLHNMFGLYEGHVMGAQKAMAALAVAGDTLDSFTLEEVERYQGKSPAWKRILNGIFYAKTLYTSYKQSKVLEIQCKTYNLLRDDDTAKSLYQRIDNHLVDYDHAWFVTMRNSACSGVWSNVLMAILSQGKPEWKTDHYSDVASLLANCENVYSADVPSSLEKLAAGIHERGEREAFLKKTPEEGVKWLQSECSSETREQFASFLRHHGHRCIREAEMRVESWRSNPKPLVKVLQAMPIKVKETHQKPKESVTDLISNLKTPLTAGARMAMKWIVPRARNAVAVREWGKSLSIEFSDKFKQAYWKLGELMVKEGRLPDADLLFFFTHYEIGLLLNHRPGKLIHKAQRRRRLLPQQMSLQFNKLNVGHPEPIDDSLDSEYVITSLKLQGMPVSQGIVKGTARIVTCLEDADQIKQGDILIVHYTDVGWSPYFPLISGLVTEIGGLVSHGAVVAREYGLPCVVNMPRATALFKTGDQVILNGTTGSLERIECPDQE